MGSNASGRMYHTMLRNGTNQLEIEKGRWKGISKDLRFCTICERHFLLSCPSYHDLREKFYQSIYNLSKGKWNFKTRPIEEVFLILMQDEHEQILFQLFHAHLERCFKLRNKLDGREVGGGG